MIHYCEIEKNIVVNLLLISILKPLAYGKAKKFFNVDGGGI